MKYRLKKDLPFAKAELENWEDIKGFGGHYKISDYGRVKSVRRIVNNSGYFNNKQMIVRGKILKQNLDTFGYPIVNLNKDKQRKTVKVHLLVWDAFGDKPRNGRQLQVDHIDNDKTNNRIENLQLLSNRENCAKGKRQYDKSSEHTGVSWNKKKGKWQATIQINGRTKHLGYFDFEIEAYQYYRDQLVNIPSKSEK